VVTVDRGLLLLNKMFKFELLLIKIRSNKLNYFTKKHLHTRLTANELGIVLPRST